MSIVEFRIVDSKFDKRNSNVAHNSSTVCIADHPYSPLRMQQIERPQNPFAKSSAQLVEPYQQGEIVQFSLH